MWSYRDQFLRVVWCQRNHNIQSRRNFVADPRTNMSDQWAYELHKNGKNISKWRIDIMYIVGQQTRYHISKTTIHVQESFAGWISYSRTLSHPVTHGIPWCFCHQFLKKKKIQMTGPLPKLYRRIESLRYDYEPIVIPSTTSKVQQHTTLRYSIGATVVLWRPLYQQDVMITQRTSELVLKCEPIAWIKQSYSKLKAVSDCN